MLVKFFSHGKSAGGGISYLLQQHDSTGKVREVAPEVVRGNPQLTQEIINSIPYTRKYTSGVLSFEESDVSKEKLDKTIDSFEEKALFPGLEKERYSALWVKHQDKGRVELHFVIANKDLETGKRLQPYYHKVDYHRVNNWKDLVNYDHGFSSPSDPQKERTFSYTSDLSATRKEAINAINNFVERKVTNGHVHNREEVISTLKEHDFKIPRIGKNYITVEDSDGRRMRLKGAYYGESFKSVRELGERNREAQREYISGFPGKIEIIREQFAKQCESRRAYLARRYPALYRGDEARDWDIAKHGEKPLEEGSRVVSQELVHSIAGGIIDLFEHHVRDMGPGPVPVMGHTKQAGTVQGNLELLENTSPGLKKGALHVSKRPDGDLGKDSPPTNPNNRERRGLVTDLHRLNINQGNEDDRTRNEATGYLEKFRESLSNRIEQFKERIGRFEEFISKATDFLAKSGDWFRNVFQEFKADQGRLSVSQRTFGKAVQDLERQVQSTEEKRVLTAKLEERQSHYRDQGQSR